MSGKCPAGGSVVLAVSQSSCSFLLMVDEVINKMSQARPCEYENIVSTLPLMNMSPFPSKVHGNFVIPFVTLW